MFKSALEVVQEGWSSATSHYVGNCTSRLVDADDDAVQANCSKLATIKDCSADVACNWWASNGAGNYCESVVAECTDIPVGTHHATRSCDSVRPSWPRF